MKTLAIGGAIAVLALAACGGGGGGSTLTKGQFDTKLSNLCLSTADKVRELHMDNSLGDWKAFGPDLVAIDHHFQTALAALKPPASIASAVAAYTTADNKAVKDDENALAVAQGKMSGTTILAQTNQANKDYLAAGRLATPVGAVDCENP